MIAIPKKKNSIYPCVLHKIGLDIYVFVSMIPDIFTKPLIMRDDSLSFKYKSFMKKQG